MRVVKAGSGDAAEIASVHIEAERQTYSDLVPSYLEHVSGIDGRTRLWRHALEAGSLQACLVLLAADASGTLAGFISGILPWNTLEARLNGIYVLKQHQRRGVGSRLLAAFAGELHSHGVQTMTCVVPAENTRAREFFEWSGGCGVQGNSPACEIPVEMVTLVWNNVEQVVNFFRVVELSRS